MKPQSDSKMKLRVRQVNLFVDANSLWKRVSQIVLSTNESKCKQYIQNYKFIKFRRNELGKFPFIYQRKSALKRKSVLKRKDVIANLRVQNSISVGSKSK